MGRPGLLAPQYRAVLFQHFQDIGLSLRKLPDADDFRLPVPIQIGVLIDHSVHLARLRLHRPFLSQLGLFRLGSEECMPCLQIVDSIAGHFLNQPHGPRPEIRRFGSVSFIQLCYRCIRQVEHERLSFQAHWFRTDIASPILDPFPAHLRLIMEFCQTHGIGIFVYLRYFVKFSIEFAVIACPPGIFLVHPCLIIRLRQRHGIGS